MKKRHLTILALGGLCSICVAVGACAATAAQQISAELRPDFTVVIDGQTKTFRNANGETVYPVLYEGTTYLPVRAIGEIMGKTVYWYENEKKVELKDEKSTVTDADVIVSGNSAPQTADGAKITADDAKAVALERAGLTADRVRFDRTELDVERGVLIYEIEFYCDNTEYSADINAADGTIVSWETENEPNGSRSAGGSGGSNQGSANQSGANQSGTNQESANQSGAKITEDRAKSIALERAGLKADAVSFEKIKLDNEHGTLVYEVEFRQGRTEYSADINAADGTIVGWEVDND